MDNESNDILWEYCVAGLVDSYETKFQVSGFSLQPGSGNVCRGCVAVGVQGTGGEASGFQWPSRMSDVWAFEDCVAHNNKVPSPGPSRRQCPRSRGGGAVGTSTEIRSRSSEKWFFANRTAFLFARGYEQRSRGSMGGRSTVEKRTRA
jgi:hypothetical protein